MPKPSKAIRSHCKRQSASKNVLRVRQSEVHWQVAWQRSCEALQEKQQIEIEQQIHTMTVCRKSDKKLSIQARIRITISNESHLHIFTPSLFGEGGGLGLLAGSCADVVARMAVEMEIGVVLWVHLQWLLSSSTCAASDVAGIPKWSSLTDSYRYFWMFKFSRDGPMGVDPSHFDIF